MHYIHCIGSLSGFVKSNTGCLKVLRPTFNTILTYMTNNYIKESLSMIIWQVNMTICKDFIAPDTDKIPATEDKLRWTRSDQFLCSIEEMFHFYCLSVGGEADTGTHQRQHTNHPPSNIHTCTHTPSPVSSKTSTPKCKPCGLKWKHVSKSENHK